MNHHISLATNNKEKLEALQVIQKYFCAWNLNSLSGKNTCCYIVKQNNKIIATSVASTLNQVEEFFPEGQKHLSSLFFSNQTFAELSVCAVVEDHKRQGIGNKLTAARLQWLKAKNIDTVLSSAVVYPDGSVPAHTQLTNNGFVAQHCVDKYWELHSHIHKYQCKRCPEGPCKCPAIIYTLKV